MMKFIEMKKSGVSFEEFSKNEKYEDVFEEFKIEVRELKRKSLFSYIEKECKEREIDEHYFIINNGFLIDDFAETYDADFESFYDFGCEENYFDEYFAESLYDDRLFKEAVK